MIARSLLTSIKKAVKTFPAVVVTGPRQSGKTTLLKSFFSSTHAYINLENPEMRSRLKTDPRGFLNQYRSQKLILDEIQYVPEFLSYIKTENDDDRVSGRWLLTGSQNFALMQGVTQSLAGQAAILSLLPLSIAEMSGLGDKTKTVSQIFLKPEKFLRKNLTAKANLAKILLRGCYPEIASNQKVDRELWCSSYITTYLERDIRNLKQVADLSQFEHFLRLCAIRTGQILDLTDLAKEIGVSVTTTRRWLSLLETGQQIYLLYPYYRNLGKRLVKRPKLYFIDVGLASFLLGLHQKDSLLAGPYFPRLFETLIVTDFLKRFSHHGQRPSLYYLKTRDGREIDLVIENEGKLILLEIKSSATITPHHFSVLKKSLADLNRRQIVALGAIISNSAESWQAGDKLFNFSWKNLLLS
jgi:hypothetical protein